MIKNPRIVIDGRLIGYRYGGIATYARKLAELIPVRAQDLRVALAVSRRDSLPDARTICTYTPPHHRMERFLLPAELMLRRPSLVHSTDNISVHIPRVPSIVTIHDLAFLRSPESVSEDSFRYYRQVLGTARIASHVIAVSNWTRRSIIEMLDVPEHRISMIYNGVDHETFRANVPEQQDIQLLQSIHPVFASTIRSPRKYLLYVGTIEPRKRVDVLIEMVSQWPQPQSADDACIPVLIIAGEAGWLAEETIGRIRVAQRSGLVVWLRDVSDHQLAALYRLSDLVLLPSREEGFGLPVLEAMASGTPVVTSGNGALSEIGGTVAFQVRSTDPRAWANTVRALLGAPDHLDKARQMGLRRAAEFTWSRCADETADLYRRVLSQT